MDYVLLVTDTLGSLITDFLSTMGVGWAVLWVAAVVLVMSGLLRTVLDD